ncbi:hypothetical protein R1flu_013661 [Riccia fluitans]|uniref:Uncharacterized protein n=1 Tax=Riccia fluitans TaxID=41844 RepID=A0ABD1YEM4_9MARC
MTGTRLSQRDFQDENQRGTSGLMGELGMNYLDETEDLAVPGGPGAEAEQQESVLLSEIFRDSNSESKGNCSDLLVEANVSPDDESRGSDLPEDTLIDVWNRVCTALQPACNSSAHQTERKLQLFLLPSSINVSRGDVELTKVRTEHLLLSQFTLHWLKEASTYLAGKDSLSAP